MIVKNSRVACYDVDETIVRWEFLSNPENDRRTIWIEREPLLPNRSIITSLKRNKARGFTIIVWSQSGSEWAEKIIFALGLQDYVDIILTKPSRYYDDLPATEWMGKWMDSKHYEP